MKLIRSKQRIRELQIEELKEMENAFMRVA